MIAQNDLESISNEVAKPVCKFMSYYVSLEESRPDKHFCRRRYCEFEHDSDGQCIDYDDERWLEDYQFEDEIEEKLLATIVELDLQTDFSVTKLKSVVTLKNVFCTISQDCDLVSTDKLDELDEILDKEIVLGIVGLTFQQDLSDESLKGLLKDNLSPRFIDEHWFDIASNWTRILNQERVEESEAVTQCRYDYLVEKGLLAQALIVAKSNPESMMFKQHLDLSLQKAEENAEAHFDEFFQTFKMNAKFEPKLFDRIMKIVPSKYKDQVLPMLLGENAKEIFLNWPLIFLSWFQILWAKVTWRL